MAKSSSSISQAHDKFFRMAMADKRTSREFFETHLPPDIRCLIDLNQIELEPGSYINDLRQESITDMLFSTEINGHRAYLHLLIEHQSRPDALMPFRILKYIARPIVLRQGGIAKTV
jgi:predicted transposase/invertase (TIGR01784 family)